MSDHYTLEKLTHAWVEEQLAIQARSRLAEEAARMGAEGRRTRWSPVMALVQALRGMLGETQPRFQS